MPSDSLVTFYCLMNSIQQFLIAKGFSQELDCSRFHGAHRHRNIAVSSDKDYGNPILGLDQGGADASAGSRIAAAAIVACCSF